MFGEGSGVVGVSTCTAKWTVDEINQETHSMGFRPNKTENIKLVVGHDFQFMSISFTYSLILSM